MQKTFIAFLLIITIATKPSIGSSLNIDTLSFNMYQQNQIRLTPTKFNTLVHTKVYVNFNWQNCRMDGKATLTLQPYYYPTDSVTIDAKGFDIKKIALMVEDKSLLDVYYKYDSNQIRIKLPKTFKQNELYKIYIEYTAKPNERHYKNGNAINNDKGLYFINPQLKEKDKPKQIWTQGETEATSCWLPTIDKPNQKTTADIFITRPLDMISISNGKKVYTIKNLDSTETDVWKINKPISPYLMMMAIGDFAISNQTWHDSIDVSYYVDFDYQEYADEIFGKTPQMMSFFSKILKYDYPWEKYSQVVVHDYVSGAMENTSATIHGDFLQRTTRELLDKSNEDVIAHELFHQWFGDLVTCESWSNVALNESFATYGQYLWTEFAYGKEIADAEFENDLQMYLTESRRKLVPIIRYDYTDADEMFDRHTYQKGARVLHMLRKMVGDSAFFQTLHQYLTTYQYKNAEIHQLRLLFEEVTGTDLNWFFNQWFLSAGHPKLQIKYSYNELQKLETVFIEQTQTEPSLYVYKFPLKIDLYYNGSIRTYKVWMDKRRQEFKLYSDLRPELVNIDAEKTLLCEKNEYKLLPDFIYQYTNAPLFKDKMEALEFISPLQKDNFNAREILLHALTSTNWHIRKFATENVFIDDSIGFSKASPMLKNIIISDAKSLVRTAAIKKIAGNKYSNTFIGILQMACKDSSYLVCAEAIKALSQTGNNSWLQICANYETENNQIILNAIAKTYADKGNMEHYSFFNKLITEKKGKKLYPFINYFGNYLYRMPEFMIEKGTLALQQVAQTDPEWTAKLAAFDAIKHFKTKYTSDTQKDRIAVINAILEEIKAKETNKQLLEYYSN